MRNRTGYTSSRQRRAGAMRGLGAALLAHAGRAGMVGFRPSAALQSCH